MTSGNSSASSLADDSLRRWRRATLAIRLWAGAAIFLIAAASWQFHLYDQTLYSIYTPLPGVKPDYHLVAKIGNPILFRGLLDGALALFALAGMFYCFLRRKRLAPELETNGS